MSRLPVVTSDINTWGTVLNDYLSVAHKADGTLNAFYNPVDSKYGADPTGAAFSTTAFTNCINDANAYNSNPDGVGAAIVVPAGYFKLNAALPTIKVPLIGSGMRRTILKQTVNLGTAGGLGGGTGVPTLVFDDPLSVQQSVFGARFSLIGPGSMGAMGAHLSAGAGIQCNTQMHLDNVEVRLFDVGGVVLNSSGGHIILFKCTIVNSYYNIWVFIDHGNNAFRDCVLVGPAHSSIAMPGGTNLDFAYLSNTHMGFGPYGIYQDSQVGIGENPNTNNNFLTGCKFANAYFESIGNAAIKSEGYNSGHGHIYGCTFENPGHLGNAGFAIAADSHDYAIWCSNLGTCRFIGGEYQFQVGDVAAMICSPQGYIEWDGTESTIVNVGNVDVPWFKLKMNPTYPRPESNGSIPGGSSSVVVSTNFAGLESQVANVVVTPTGVGAQTGAFALYVTNIKSSPSHLYPRVPTLALVATGTGNLGIGTYWYGMTYVNDLGETQFSWRGTASITTDSSHKQVTVTLPSFPQLGGIRPITSRKLYRGAVGVSTQTSLQLLTTINDGYTTTSFTDNVADGSLGAFYTNVDTAGGTRFTVNCQPANPAGTALPFNWKIPT